MKSTRSIGVFCIAEGEDKVAMWILWVVLTMLLLVILLISIKIREKMRIQVFFQHDFLN